MRTLGHAADVIKTALTAHFPNVPILDVSVRLDLDHEGLDILRVDVLFDGAPRDLDARKTSSVARIVRPKLLREANITAFPVFSFISRSDLGARKFVAA